MAYVAYASGLGVAPGEVVNPDDFDEEDWNYHVARGNVVKQGGDHDPNVLAARAAGEDYKDPRDARIAALEAELLRLNGKPGTPAPGAFQTENADDDDEDPKTPKGSGPKTPPKSESGPETK